MIVQQPYLETEVMSASGPKLRLMLIEGALRFARQSLRETGEGDFESALAKLTRVRKILWELLLTVGEGDPEIIENIRRVYTFLIRVVTEAQLTGDPQQIVDVIEVLEIERETWRELSARLLVQGTPSQTQVTQTGADYGFTA